MAVEQMNISLSPKMAKFIRSKVKTGSYTNISEVVRTAVRRMQEEEAREAKRARSGRHSRATDLLRIWRWSTDAHGKVLQPLNVAPTPITLGARGLTSWQPR